MSQLDGKFCMICNAKTHAECGTCGHVTPNDQYTLVEVEWSNGSKMMVGICVECATKNLHTLPTGKAAITKAHHEAWDTLKFTHDPEIVLV